MKISGEKQTDNNDDADSHCHNVEDHHQCDHDDDIDESCSRFGSPRKIERIIIIINMIMMMILMKVAVGLAHPEKLRG